MFRAVTTRIEAVMSRPVEKTGLFSLENILLLISKIYGAGVGTRLALYRAGIFKSKKLPCFVISIGNIAVGGTGKTPMTIYIAHLLRQMGCKVAVVSRGYGGKYERSCGGSCDKPYDGKGGVVCDGKRLCCTPEESGDEAYMIAQTLGIPVVVGKDRYAAGMMAIQKFNVRVIVLDDAFQHMGLKRDLDLVLMDAGHPFGNGELLPRGRLRECVSSIIRSDALFMTRSDQAANQAFTQELAPEFSELKLSGQVEKKIPIFKTFHVPFISKIVPKIENLNQGNSNGHYRGDLFARSQAEPDNWAWIRGKSCLLFSGLANNKAFRKSCRERGMKIAGYIDFPDHFWYSQADIDRILTKFMDVQADFIVTTEKDYVKISSRFFLAPLVVVGVKIVFDEASLALFDSFIKASIGSLIPER